MRDEYRMPATLLVGHQSARVVAARSNLKETHILTVEKLF